MRSTLFFLFFLITANAFSQTSNAVLLNRDTHIEISGSKLVQTESFSILINSKAGEKYTKIELPYSKLTKITNIRANVTDLSGKVIYKLNSSDIEDRSRLSNITFYDDARVKSFYLNHNRYPYKISYSYTRSSSNFIQIADWYPLLDKNITTINASLSLTIPIDYEINIRERKLPSAHYQQNKTETIYYWETSYEGNILNEEFAPPLQEVLPNISVIPLDFKYDIPGGLRTWKDLGNWQYLLLTNSNDLPAQEIREIINISNKSDNEIDKIRNLYHYLQDNTRYINVSLETGGLKPYSARYVSENKYGDCKALSNYFRTVLSQAGIQSYYTKVFAGIEPVKVDTLFPSQQFNHIILFIPLKNDTIWLDCTSKGPFGYLGTFTQNRHVLIVENGKSRILKTPSLMPDDVKEERLIRIENNGTQNSLVNVTSTFKGEKCEDVRSILLNFNKSDQDRIFHDYLSINKLELMDFSIEPFERDSSSIRISSNAEASNLYKKYGNEILAANLSFSLPDIEDKEVRNHPIRVNLPINLIDSVLYEIPYGYDFDGPSEMFEIENEFGRYSWEASLKNDRIIVIKRFLLNAGEFESEKYPLLRNFISRAKKNENRTYIIFRKSNP